MTALRTPLEDAVTAVEQHLNTVLEESGTRSASLQEAARYTLSGGGKRLRPLLVLVVNKTLGGEEEDALDAACALEYIHNYSLVHDDLPCMDDDDFRRGRPSLHKQTNESLAVLTGDYLLTYAFELIAKSTRLSSAQKVAITLSLAQGSGGAGMIAGQVMDLEAEHKDLSVAQLDAIHLHKSAALIATSMEIGAICAGASSEVRQKLYDAGLHLGHAFQIIDDILDDEQDSGTEGCANNYVALLGREQSLSAAEELLRKALHLIHKLPGDTSQLVHLAERLVHRSH